MRKTILMNQFHIDLYVRRGLREAEYQAIRRTINAKSFVATLRRALRETCKTYPALGKVRITVSN